MALIALDTHINYNIPFYKGIFMKKWEKIPNQINGFEIIEDYGICETGRYGLVICKACNKEFSTSLYTLHIIKSCGCIKYNQIKSLPAIINGFKIIKDLGCIQFGKQAKRRVIVECKVCHRHYECTPTYLKDRKHCGCIAGKTIKSKYAKKYPRLNGIYKGMKSRCYNKNHKDWHLYGGRGIKIFPEWLKDRNSFFEWALKNGYSDDLTIDRINNNKGYNPKNCKWSDEKTQARNTRRNILTMNKAREIRLLKELKPKELSKKFKVSKSTIWLVLNNKIWRE